MDEEANFLKTEPPLSGANPKAEEESGDSEGANAASHNNDTSGGGSPREADPSAQYYKDFQRSVEEGDEGQDEEEDEEDEGSDRALMRSSAPPSSSHRSALGRPVGLPSIVDSLLQQHHPTSLTASHPPPPSATLFNPSIPFASSSSPSAESPTTNFLDSLTPDNFQMTIVVQPPLKTVYQRILKPFPSVCLNIVSTNGSPVPDDTICEGLFVEATLLRGDNGVPLPKCIDGNCVVRFERRSRSMNEGLFATFKKLKILSTSQQLQGTLLRLKFTLKKYSGNSFATIQVPNCSVISHPIEVFSHTQYLNKNKDSKAPSLPQPVLDYFAQAEERKSRQDWVTPVSPESLKMSTEISPMVTEKTVVEESVKATNTPPATPTVSTTSTTTSTTPTMIAPSPPVKRITSADMSLEVVRALQEYKAQGGSYQTAISWVNHVFGVQTGGVMPQPPVPTRGNRNQQGSSFLRSSLDSLSTLRSSGTPRTAPVPSSPSVKAAPFPVPTHTASVSLSGAPASSRKKSSSLSVSSPNVPILRKHSDRNRSWNGGDLSGLEALATTSTQSLNASKEIMEDTELVSGLITDLKNGKTSWEKFTASLHESLGEAKALHVISSLPPEIHSTFASASFTVEATHLSESNKAATTTTMAPTSSRKRNLVQSTEALSNGVQKGRRGRRPAQPVAQDEAPTLPPAEKKMKLTRSTPGVPTKARATSPPVQPALTEAVGSSLPANGTHQVPPPELLLAQLSTYRSNSPVGGGSSASPPQPSSPPTAASGQAAAINATTTTTTTTSSTPRAASDSPVNRWYWKNDEAWEPYSDDISRELEKAYNLHTVCYIILENVPYKMDFRTMVQIRMDSTKRWRHIRRDCVA